MPREFQHQESDTLEVKSNLLSSCDIGIAIPHTGQGETPNTPVFQKRKHRQSGQIVFEYVLLLVISVGAATMLTKLLVSRNADKGGAITNAWARNIDAIGADIID